MMAVWVVCDGTTIVKGTRCALQHIEGECSDNVSLFGNELGPGQGLDAQSSYQLRPIDQRKALCIM